MIPRLSHFSSHKILGSLKMQRSRGDTVRNFVFQEKNVEIPTIVTGIDQDLILDLVEGTTN